MNEFPKPVEITQHYNMKVYLKNFNLLNVKVMQNFNDLIEYIWIQIFLKQLRIQGWFDLLGKNIVRKLNYGNIHISQIIYITITNKYNKE